LLLGHLKVELGIVFQLFEGATFSDGALKAIDEASAACSGRIGKKSSNLQQITKPNPA